MRNQSESFSANKLDRFNETKRKVATTLAIAAVGLGLGACDNASAAPENTTTIEQPSSIETTPPAPVETPTPEATTPTKYENLNPETAEVVTKLEAMDYSEFTANTTPQERAIWCEGDINPDIRTTAATWHQQTGNPFDILPEATTANTPQEIITLIGYQVRQATVGHFYDPDNGIAFDLEKTRKAMACINYDTSSGFAKSQDQFVKDSFNTNHLFGLKAEGIAMAGSLPMETAVDSREPTKLPDGTWNQDIQARDGINGTSTDWRNIARVEYPFNGETHIMYMINTSDNTPNN